MMYNMICLIGSRYINLSEFILYSIIYMLIFGGIILLCIIRNKINKVADTETESENNKKERVNIIGD